MYGNTGDTYVQIKKLCLDGLLLDKVGEEFKIGEYYSTPHGFTALNHGGCLLYVPDNIFEEHFVRWGVYKQYYRLGDIISINANGNLGDYSIEGIEGDSHYVTLRLEKN